MRSQTIISTLNGQIVLMLPTKFQFNPKMFGRVGISFEEFKGCCYRVYLYIRMKLFLQFLLNVLPIVCRSSVIVFVLLWITLCPF